jgi:threonine 3-dehydrogenase
VLVRVTAASICGTDVHIYDWDAWSQGRIRPPLILGHEFAGVVEAVGSGVSDLALGTPVSAEGHIVPEGDPRITAGQEHLAAAVEVIGIDRPGAFAEFVVMPRRNIWVNPPDLPPAVASLQDPFGNAVHTVYMQEVAGRHVLVTGAGLIGLMTVPVAKVAGAAQVIVTDVNPGRLEWAQRLGADVVLDARQDTLEHVLAATGGRGADVLLEMSGHPGAIAQGLEALRPGGEAALLGLPSGDVTVDWGNLVVLKGVTLRGVYGRRIWDTWHRMRGLLETGAVDLAQLITHEFPLEQFEEAFAVMHSGTGGKVILRPGAPGL